MDSLVSTEWLAAHLREGDVRIVDSSWHMAATPRRGRDGYLRVHYDKLGVEFQSYRHWLATGAHVPTAARM